MKKFCLIWLVLLFALSGVACFSQSRPTAPQVASEVAEEAQKGRLAVYVGDADSSVKLASTNRDSRAYISAEISYARVGLYDKTALFSEQVIEIKKNQGVAIFEDIPPGRYNIHVYGLGVDEKQIDDDIALWNTVDINAGNNTAMVNWQTMPTGQIFWSLAGTEYFLTVSIEGVQKLVDAFLEEKDIIKNFDSHPSLIQSGKIAEDIIAAKGKIPEPLEKYIKFFTLTLIIKGLPEGEKVSAWVDDPASPKLSNLGNGSFIIKPIQPLGWKLTIWMDPKGESNVVGMTDSLPPADAEGKIYYEADLSKYFPQVAETGLQIDFGPEGKVLVAPEVKIISDELVIEATAGETVRFTARATDEGTIIEVAWNFGDGSVVPIEGGEAESAEIWIGSPISVIGGGLFGAENVYLSPGVYTVTVKVVDDDGLSATDSVKVWVVEAPDVISPAPPTSVFIQPVATAGGSIQISWQNPSEEDFTLARVYRSETKGELGKYLCDVVSYPGAKPTIGNHLWNGEIELGVKYYYTIHSVDKVGNESTNTDQYEGILWYVEPEKGFEVDNHSVDSMHLIGQDMTLTFVWYDLPEGVIEGDTLVSYFYSQEKEIWFSGEGAIDCALDPITGKVGAYYFRIALSKSCYDSLKVGGELVTKENYRIYKIGE